MSILKRCNYYVPSTNTGIRYAPVNKTESLLRDNNGVGGLNAVMRATQELDTAGRLRKDT